MTGPLILFYILQCSTFLLSHVTAQGGQLEEQRHQYKYKRSFGGGGATASNG